MPQIQFNIPKDLDKKIKHYMIDHNIVDKRIAITKILTNSLSTELKKKG